MNLLTGHDEIRSDVQAEKGADLLSLTWVGMSQIQSAIAIDKMQIPCALDIGVDLKAGFRGIHMSRLYQVHHDFFLNRPLDMKQIELFLTECLKSQAETSCSVAAKVSFQMPTSTLSLKSQMHGYRNYPVELIFQNNERETLVWARFEILYSSTCPQSASLSYESLQKMDVLPNRLPATPHAQRSRATIKIQASTLDVEQLRQLIFQIENALGTPVQTAVKKADELEFARLNAENLMFCEDANRVISKFLSGHNSIKGYSVYCEHLESLHPHNATSLKISQYSPPTQLLFS